MLAMVQHPEIQAQAQAEIDRVTGSRRLPDIADRESMPYVQRIVREALRWQPVLPLGLLCITEYMRRMDEAKRIALGFPRASLKDDEYKGYFIPKGSIVYVKCLLFVVR